jgi:pyruvate dehydrogenase kinase 2/3/4
MVPFADALIAAGTLFRASQFLSEELPIRLAHRVRELNSLPDGLNEMPSIQKVQDWYAQSFEVSFTTPLFRTPVSIRH